MATDVVVKDSVETLSSEFARQLSSQGRGKLRKGVASAQASVPTIPSKYFTVLTDNNEKKGFQRTSKRFAYNYTDTPGPGSYANSSPASIRQHSPSHSRKGYGPFASAAPRIPQKLNPDSTPGAGTYDHHHPDESLNSTSSMSNTNKKPTSSFQLPIAVKHDQENDMPAPNAYDVYRGMRLLHKQNNVSAAYAFKSTTRRQTTGGGLFPSHKSDENVRVAPNSYFVNDDMLHAGARVPYSSFKSSTRRNTFMAKSAAPAPNQYHPNEPITEPIDRLLFPRRHYLAISAPAVPMTPEPPLPGPGAYNVRDFREPEKKYMSSAAFVSSTGRLINEAAAAPNAQAMPGPGSYSPAKMTKQSFHYNYDRKWV